MKKSLLVVSALAALAMLFVSCGGNSDPTVGGGDDTPAEVVIYDPSVDGASTVYINDSSNTAVEVEGEIVEVNGEKYLKVLCYQYNTYLSINPEVDCSKYGTLSVTFGANNASGMNASIVAKDAANAEVYNVPYYGVAAPAEKTAGYATKQSWNEVSETKKVAKVYFQVQDPADNYAAQNDVEVLIGKIVAKKN